MTVTVGRSGAPVVGCNDADEFGELVRFVGSAPRRKHVVGQVIDVAPQPVVGTEECLHMPRALDRVRISTTSYVRNKPFVKFIAETMKRA